MYALEQEQEAWVFANPVDAVALGLHDYHTIITRPMDLGSVGHPANSPDLRSKAELAWVAVNAWEWFLLVVQRYMSVGLLALNCVVFPACRDALSTGAGL